MMSTCDQVSERVAVGEALDELAEHAQACARCGRLVGLAGKLGATHREIDPGLGFSARMTAGAQHRLGVRRRRRIAAGFAATVAAGLVAVVVVTRAPPPATPTVATDTRPAPEPVVEPVPDEDLEMLVNYADVERSSRLSARWREIERPLVPYRQLLQGVTP